MRQLRCAIYTRKSSEEGLEQDFNSLDAQYAACSAYVASQASEGWTLIGKRYDDGGISGGTLERPGLQRMLTDIAAGRIDIVVVYKVDRLTRSLLDFAKLVESFDRGGTSFVSVTQSFNTTTSMGRLTLNMLLSFAQFEREVTAERIRDKLAASKQRGMWMGGTPPLGYRPNGRSLQIVGEHADLVRLIFQRYLELGNLRLLQNELTRHRIVKPVRTTKSGRVFGGTSFGRGELHAILSNPIYIGRIRHRNQTYDGLHQAIVDQPLWDAVQALLAENCNGERRIRSVVHRSVLPGKLFDATGEKLVASHASKGTRRYRYYISSSREPSADSSSSMRIPAREIEALVCSRIAELFDNPVALIQKIAGSALAPDATAHAISTSQNLAATLRSSDPEPIGGLIDRIVERIEINSDAITIVLDAREVARCLDLFVAPRTMENSWGAEVASASAIEIKVPVTLKRSGLAMRLILPAGGTATPRVDERLVQAIATAHGWWEELVGNPKMRLADLAASQGVTESWITRSVRLAFLDPALVEQILAGTAPAHLTVDALRTPDAVPALWSAQRALHHVYIAA
jgi:DNA invertase Pin-like site-specific DNA recombinase